MREMVPYSDWERLKPIALEILYSFETTQLPYYTETNKCGDIIRILIKHNIDG